jgi:hypothetical protein
LLSGHQDGLRSQGKAELGSGGRHLCVRLVSWVTLLSSCATSTDCSSVALSCRGEKAPSKARLGYSRLWLPQLLV